VVQSPAPQLEIRAGRPDELEVLLATFGSAFGFGRMDDEDRALLEHVLDPGRMLSVTEGQSIVAVAGALAFTLTIPGGDVPVAGVTLVAVRPSHRRRGILSQMMRRQLADIRSWGEPLAMLWASESSIYERFGYGMATLRSTIDIERDRAVFRGNPTPVGLTRLVDVDEALETFPIIHERARPRNPGWVKRSREWWQYRRLADLPRHRGAGGPMFRAVLEIHGKPEAYALYRMHVSWATTGLPDGWLDVLEAVGTSPLATREIWRFLFGIDLINRVRSSRLGPELPLLHQLTEPRRLRMRVFDGIWLRIVELQSALAARSYADAGSLVFELADDVCPWNAGRWRLDAGDGRGRVGGTSEAAELRIEPSDLGAVYLGGVTFAQLGRAGRLEELQPGAIRRADALFRADVAPWCPDDF
jgi:predicted acetyltransferase